MSPQAKVLRQKPSHIDPLIKRSSPKSSLFHWFLPRILVTFLKTHFSTLSHIVSVFKDVFCCNKRHGPGTWDQGPGTKDQGPETKDQRPGTKDQGPRTKDQGSVTSDQGSGTMNKEPETKDQRPGTKDQGPGTRDKGPGTRDQGVRDQGGAEFCPSTG